MKIIIALLLLVDAEALAQPITIPTGRLWSDTVVWQTTEEFAYAYAEEADLLFLPHAMRYILVYDTRTGIRTDTIDLVEVFGREEVEIHEISCSRNGDVIAIGWNDDSGDSADCVVFRYPSLELIREHVIGDSQPAYKQIYWFNMPITVSPKGTYLACTGFDGIRTFLVDLNSTDEPINLRSTTYLSVAFDTAESVMAVWKSPNPALQPDTAQINIIELTNPDSVVRSINVVDVGSSRHSASFGMSADGSEVFYGGDGSRRNGPKTYARCGTWSVSTGAITRELDASSYGWSGNRFSTNGQWFAIKARDVAVFDRGQDTPTYQLPRSVDFLSQDLKYLYWFNRSSTDTVSFYCDTLTSEIPTTVNEPRVKAPQDWKIFPNPANGVLTLKQADSQLRIYDLLDWKIIDASGKEMSRGRIRFEGAQSEVPIPIELTGGQYFITLSNGTEQVMTQSFVVAR